jgi:Arc/MetJ family transcription regulator
MAQTVRQIIPRGKPKRLSRSSRLRIKIDATLTAAFQRMVRHGVSDRPETVLETAQRHVREGERRLIRMAAMIDAIDRDKYPKAAAMGKVLLKTMSTSLDIWKLHLIRIESRMQR